MKRRPPPERPAFLGDLVRDILDDVRGKLIDEAWFGRPRAERQQHYDDMRAFYGRDPEPPSAWGQMDWADRLGAEEPGIAEKREVEIDR